MHVIFLLARCVVAVVSVESEKWSQSDAKCNMPFNVRRSAINSCNFFINHCVTCKRMAHGQQCNAAARLGSGQSRTWEGVQESRHYAWLLLYFERTDDKSWQGAFTISKRCLAPTGREVDQNPEPPSSPATEPPPSEPSSSPAAEPIPATLLLHPLPTHRSQMRHVV